MSISKSLHSTLQFVATHILGNDPYPPEHSLKRYKREFEANIKEVGLVMSALLMAKDTNLSWFQVDEGYVAPIYHLDSPSVYIMAAEAPLTSANSVAKGFALVYRITPTDLPVMLCSLATQEELTAYRARNDKPPAT